MKMILITILAVIAIGCSTFSHTKYSNDKNRVSLEITANTTKDELTEIAAKFKSLNNIDVNFAETEFYSDGTIKHLYLEVDCNDGFKGRGQSPGLLLKFFSFGFIRDYSAKAKSIFAIGQI